MSSTENNIQHRLYNLEVSFPDDMWNRIEKELPKKSKKKGFYWFFIIGFILLGSGLFLFNWNETFIKTSKNSLISESRQNERKPAPLIYSEGTNDESVIPEENAKQTTTSDVELKSTPLPISSSISNVSEQADKWPINTEIDKTKVNETPRPVNIPDVLYLAESSAKYLLNTKFRKKVIVSDISQISILALKNQDIILGPECPPFSRLSSYQILMELYYGTDISIRSFSAKNSEFRDYAIERKNSESFLYSFSGGARLAYLSSKKYGIKTGVNYTQINEQFAYFDPDAYQSRTVITIDTIFSGGVPTIVSDTSFITIPGTQEVQSVNRYRMIDIPVIGTFEFNLGNNFYYAIDAGIYINLSFSQKGRYLNESGNVADLSPNNTMKEQVYQSNVGLSFYGGLTMFYNWKENVDLFVSPSLRYLPQSFTTRAYSLDQNYYLPSLNVGIRYKIK